MKKLLAIALCVLVHAAFGNTNSLVELAKSLDDLTNGWHKLTYDQNARAERMMCPKCGFSCPVRPGRWIKVGKSNMKCTYNRGQLCNEKMWYVDEWMMLNFCHTRLRNAAIIANEAFDKAIARGDNKEAEEWLGRLRLVRDDMAKLMKEKDRYLARKKRR